MAEEFGKMNSFNNTSYFTSFENTILSGQNTIQHNENMAYQKK
jgi:uncharacterized protein YqfB (UPF0267 family)